MCIPLFDKKHAFKLIYIIIIIILHFWHLKHISLSQCLRYFQGFFKMFLEVPYKPWTNYNDSKVKNKRSLLNTILMEERIKLNKSNGFN